jgi:small-conductance mechanosensitive channel
VVAAKGAVDFDYDELARRLLVQVVQRLAAPGQEIPLRAGAGPAGAGPAGAEEASPARTVASLEHKLASVRSRQRKLSEENARLREQLRAVQESLAQAEEQAAARRGPGQLDSTEVRLLDRLLSPLREKGDRREEAGAS